MRNRDFRPWENLGEREQDKWKRKQRTDRQKMKKKAKNRQTDRTINSSCAENWLRVRKNDFRLWREFGRRRRRRTLKKKKESKERKNAEGQRERVREREREREVSIHIVFNSFKIQRVPKRHPNLGVVQRACIHPLPHPRLLKALRMQAQLCILPLSGAREEKKKKQGRVTQWKQSIKTGDSSGVPSDTNDIMGTAALRARLLNFLKTPPADV